MPLQNSAGSHQNSPQRVSYLCQDIISFSAAVQAPEPPIWRVSEQNKSQVGVHMRRSVTRKRPAPPRQSRAALRRVRSSARSFFSTLPPRAKWRPNWDLALAGKSLYNLTHIYRVRSHWRISLRNVVHPRSIREEFEGVVGHRLEGGAESAFWRYRLIRMQPTHCQQTILYISKMDTVYTNGCFVGNEWSVISKTSLLIFVARCWDCAAIVLRLRDN